MWTERPTELNSIFFANLDTFLELTMPTGDKNFDTYVKNFYNQNLKQRTEELSKKMRASAVKYRLLEDFDFNLDAYRYKIKEINWPYQSEEERNKNIAIYNFLCENKKPSSRKITKHRLKNEYYDCKNEILAIQSVEENLAYKKHIDNLKLADKFYQSLSRRFVYYSKCHPDSEIVKKYNLPKNFDRNFFETHIDEIKALKNIKEHSKE